MFNENSLYEKDIENMKLSEFMELKNNNNSWKFIGDEAFEKI